MSTSNLDENTLKLISSNDIGKNGSNVSTKTNSTLNEGCIMMHQAMNRENSNQQLMYLMDKTRKLIWRIWVGYWRANNDVLTDPASEVLNTLKKVIAFNQTT